MAKIPFNVSARTARLIGRENVSNADGAIIELVKNCYDADADSCIVFFDNKSEAKASLYIIDNGDGMSEKVIKNHWMTIGTSNKLKDFYTGNKRVKTGAKGIGRFALDRLGKKCEMLTLPKEKQDGFEWKVDWTDFEQEGAHLAQVNADLSDISKLNLKEKIDALFTKIKKPQALKNFNHGTVIKISGLNDEWDDQLVERVYRDLELLTPPEEEKNFNIFLFSTLKPEAYGKVSSVVNEDYDYKLVANVDKNKNARVVITRNEFDVKAVDDDIFKRPEMKKFPYDRKTFRKKSFSLKTTLNELLPGSSNDQLDLIGPFSFTFYFMKRTYDKTEPEKFFYKHFEAKNRSDWLKRFGGIKLFRDNFWIRPYGETGSAAFDWLGLGERAAISPAGITKQGAGWRVRPNQVAGVIKISRITNIRFEDKSSREGLQENQTFETFRNIILKLINKFEEDRHKVMRPMLLTYDEKHQTEQIKSEGLNLATTSAPQNDKPLGSLTDREKLAKAVIAINQEKEELKEEFRLSRALASAGLIITSFSHELQHLSSLLKVRNIQLENILQKVIPKKNLKNLPDHEDPFVMLKDMADEDAKLQNWIQFSLSSVSKDKRTRVSIDLLKYFKAFQGIWSKTLEFRKVTLVLPSQKQGKYLLRAFPIDIDSIFNNLLANSLDAFKRGMQAAQRKISIKIAETKQNLQITYEDTGPGLDANIKNPYQILEPFFTTKVDSTGKEVGTGLGMWIVKNIVDEYKGKIEILNKRPGFKIKIILPKPKAHD